MTTGTCDVDAQGNPLPSLGIRTCDLAGFHLDAQAIEEVSANKIYSGRMANTGKLDWEFFAIDPNSTPSGPSTDLYDPLYSFGSFEAYTTPVNPQNKMLPPMPSNPVQTGGATPAPVMQVEERGPLANQQLFILLGIIALAFYLGTK